MSGVLNLLIYLGPVLHERIIPIFHYALKPTGFLRLGPAESVDRFSNLFAVVDKKNKIYARKPGSAAHLAFGLTAEDRMVEPARPGQPARGPAADASEVGIEREADRIVMTRYAPAGVIVNAHMEIVQFRGKTGPYLEAMPGAASLNLFKMAREGLLSALRQAVHQAAKDGAPTKTEGLRVKTNGGVREVSLEVIPIAPADAAKGRHYLVVFDERRQETATPPEPAPQRASRSKTAVERQVARLTDDLAATRQHLQATLEEHEAANEEIRAATEELPSSNEELQSTNEELETAKEELQATNEELTTVNDELNSRNVELSQLGNDLANLLASVHVPILMVGANLRLRRMTPATERLLNVAPGDIGRPISDLRLSVDVPRLESLIREVMETLTPGECEVEARDGHWYSVRVRPYRTGDNKIDGAVISFIDVDPLKRALDQAQAIIETVRGPLVILDADLRVVRANRSFYETFQVTPTEMERQSIFDVGGGQWNVPRLRELLEEILPRDNMFQDFEVDHEFQKIGRRTMRLNARRVLSAGGQPALILLAIDDMTEVRRLEAARADLLKREQAIRAEEEASRAKDTFLAVLSHELRTPLTAMLGWVRMLRTEKLDQAAAARALEVIERNTRLQARMIEDLLDVSRIVAGRLRLEARPVMVAPAVEASVVALRPAAEAKGIRLESVLDEAAGPIQGDPTRLQQIVWNLASNAIKFTPSGGRVDVRLARRDGMAEISVRDTGRGIAAERLPQIFTRFGGAPSTLVGEGLGLGLSIVRHLVELHGGSIRAESAGPGMGATFTVTLPLTKERPTGEAEAHKIVAGKFASDSLQPLDGVRVLVVDDEADTRELLGAVLEQFGAEVTAVASVEAALEAVEQAKPDVLVSDIAMAEQNGYDLIRKLKEREPARGGSIPALALSAYARIEDREQAIAAGYQMHLAKPIEPAKLVATVATLAGRAEQNRGG